MDGHVGSTGALTGIETSVQQLAQKLAECLPVTIASVALWDRPSFSLTVKAVGTVRPLGVPLPLWTRVALATAAAHRAALERQEPVFLDLESSDPSTIGEAARALIPDLRTIYLLPIRLGEEIVGIVGLGEMRSVARESISTEKRERCNAMLEEFLASSAQAWEAGRLREQVRTMASLLRMVRETFDARTCDDVLAICAAEAGGWLGAPVRALLFRVEPSGRIAVASRYRFDEPVTFADSMQIVLAVSRSRAQSEWPVTVGSVADDLLDPVRGVMPKDGRWTRITFPLIADGRLWGLVCMYVEEDLHLTSWELEALRQRAEITAHALALVSTLEEEAHERAWLGRAAYETLSTSQRRALREALKGIDRLVGTFLPERIRRLVTEGGALGLVGLPAVEEVAEAVTREVAAVLQGLGGEDPTGPTRRWEVDLNGLVQRVTSMARASLQLPTDPQRRPVQFRLELLSEPLVALTTPELVAALVHAIENAVESMPEGGEICVRTGRENGHALISVEDSGPGVTALEDAFAPLVSTKNKPHMGLGLSVIRGVVNQHGGTTSLLSPAGGGALLQIRLPLVVGGTRSTSEQT